MAAQPSSERLLERQAELAALATAWRQAQDGDGSLWWVRAEAGGGKTRLMAELAAGRRVLWGAAEPVSPPEPYLALTTALPGFLPAASRAESVNRVIAHLEQEVANGGPVLLVLDDLHWCDDGTVAVLVRLAQRCRRQPWLILAACRPAEGSEALRLALSETAAQGSATLLDLPALSEAGVRALASRVRGATISEEEAMALAAGSGGNPWLVETLAAGGRPAVRARERVLGQVAVVERQQPGAAALLAALAPAGEPLPHPVVALLAGGDGPRTRHLLTALRDAGLLREEGEGWQFRHELLRAVVLDTLIAADRRDAHRVLAAALEQSAVHLPPGQAGAVRLAMHYAEAGDPRAHAWALRASRAAGDVDAHAEALAQAQRALSFAQDEEQRRTALRACERPAFRLGRFADARSYAEQALALAGGDDEVRANLHRRAANAARLSGDFAAAARHMDQAVATLADQPVSNEKVKLAVARVLQAQVGGDVTLTEQRAAHALELAGQLPDKSLASTFVLETRSYLGMAQLTAGDPAGFASFEAIAVLGAVDPRFEREVLIGMNNAYGLAVLSLFHDDAVRYRERLEAGMRRHDLGWQNWILPYHALEMVQRGDYAGARALLATVRPQPPALEHAVHTCAALLLEARAGSVHKARMQHSAVRWAPGPVHGLLRDVVLLDIAAFDEELRAQTSFERIYRRSVERQQARPAAVAAVALARWCAEAPAAPPWLTQDSPLHLYWRWAAALVDHDRAALLTIADQLDALHLPWDAALTRRDGGDTAAAYRRFRDLEAVTAREETAALLRAAGQPVPRRSRAGQERDLLTDTERALCRLVAGGERTADIAEKLGIGERTVETHLTRIYQKTGVRGRGALAAWWTAQNPAD